MAVSTSPQRSAELSPRVDGAADGGIRISEAATRGVPRARRAISPAPLDESERPSNAAARPTMRSSSAGV